MNVMAEIFSECNELCLSICESQKNVSIILQPKIAS